MSRLGKQPITIPDGVTVEVINGDIGVKGPKGELKYGIRPEIEVQVKDGNVETSIKKETKESNAYWGLTRAIINNMVQGVNEGYEKKLELVGVGYRVTSVDSRHVSITVGYSHPVEFEAPEGIELEIEGNKEITVKGIDKQLVGLTAARIRKIRKPEPYKGKGIRYADEVVRRKPGKAGTVQSG
jgi:large subunit ribosomal protein L6